MEGIVSRDSQGFHVDDFMAHVFKYVRKTMSKQISTGNGIGREPSWPLNYKENNHELAINPMS